MMHTARAFLGLVLCVVACTMSAQQALASASPSPQPSASGAPGPSPSPTASATPGSLAPIVVTAQRRPLPIDASSRQTYLVTPEDLERLGALTAADALRFVPGTVVQQYGAYGSLGTVALRGSSTSQTLVLIDGQPANESDTGVFDFSSLPANLIDRIEVVQGGSSTLYGSSAMGGVVNIITKHPVSAGNVNLYGQVGYQGSFLGGLGFTFGGPDMLARVDMQTATAQSGFAYPAFDKLYPPGIRTNTEAKSTDSGIAVTGHLGVVNLNASFHNDTSAIGIPGSVFFASDTAQQQRVYQRGNLSLDLPLRHGDIVFETSTSGRRLHFFDPAQPFPYDNQANGDTRTASLRSTFELGPWNVLTAGYDVSGSSATFNTAYVPPNGPEPKPCQGLGPTSFESCRADDASSAWYAQDEVHKPGSNVTLSAGVRDQRTQGTMPVAVPSFGAAMRVSSGVDLLANYGRAFRTPNLDERYYPGYGSATLSPEYGATFDIGARCRVGSGECSFAYFGQDTSNLIVSVPVDAFGDVQPVNISRARVRGLEASASQRIGSYGHSSITYTDYIQAADLTPGNVQPIRLLYRPTSTGSLTLWVGRGTWTYGLDTTYVGRRYADEKNMQVLRPYLLTSVHVKKILSRRLALTLRVDNVANNHNAEDVLGYPVVGSAFSVRLSTR